MLIDPKEGADNAEEIKDQPVSPTEQSAEEIPTGSGALVD